MLVLSNSSGAAGIMPWPRGCSSSKDDGIGQVAHQMPSSTRTGPSGLPRMGMASLNFPVKSSKSVDMIRGHSTPAVSHPLMRHIPGCGTHLRTCQHPTARRLTCRVCRPLPHTPCTVDACVLRRASAIMPAARSGLARAPQGHRATPSPPWRLLTASHRQSQEGGLSDVHPPHTR